MKRVKVIAFACALIGVAIFGYAADDNRRAFVGLAAAALWPLYLSWVAAEELRS